MRFSSQSIFRNTGLKHPKDAHTETPSIYMPAITHSRFTQSRLFNSFGKSYHEIPNREQSFPQRWVRVTSAATPGLLFTSSVPTANSSTVMFHNQRRTRSLHILSRKIQLAIATDSRNRGEAWRTLLLNALLGL